MADPYRVVLHPDLARQRQALEASANDMSPTKDAAERARDANELRQLDSGLDALAEGREAMFGGKRLISMRRKYPEIGDHAELKIPVVPHFTPDGRRRTTPSHRLTYQEAEGTSEDPRPVRRAVAFEPRRDAMPFFVTGQRLGRAIGVSIQELDDARAEEGTTGTEMTPVRMKAGTALATAIHAGTNPGYEKGGTVRAPTETPVATKATGQAQPTQHELTQN